MAQHPAQAAAVSRLPGVEHAFGQDMETPRVAFGDAPHPLGSIIVKTVRDYTDRTINDGDTVLEKALFDNLQLIFSLLEETNLPVIELRIDDLKFKEATVVVGGGPDIYFSLLLNPSFGKSVIESLSSSSEWANIRYIDLRVENRAYYSL